MRARRNQLEQYHERKRDSKDRRKFVAWAVFSYLTDSGIEYRRAVTAEPLTPERNMWDIAPLSIEVRE